MPDYSVIINAKGAAAGKIRDSPGFYRCRILYENDTRIAVFWRLSVNIHRAVGVNGYLHSVLYIGEKIVAEGVHRRERGTLKPYVREDRTCRGERIYRFGEQKARRLSPHCAGAIEDEPAGCRAYRAGEAECLAAHFLSVKVGVVLVAAGGFLIPELERLLKGGECVKSSVGDKRLGCQAPGGYDSSLESFHAFSPPVIPVISARISSSV